MDEKFVKSVMMNANIDPKFEKDILYLRLVDGTFYNRVVENGQKNLVMRVNVDRRSEFQAEIHSL